MGAKSPYHVSIETFGKPSSFAVGTAGMNEDRASLATATAHRRRQYGLLLMSGITPGDVGYIVAFQIFLSCVVGGIAGYVVYLATAAGINALLADSSIVADARLIIGLDVTAFLPSLSGLAVAGLWSGMTLLAVGVGTIILRFQGITNAAAPITLVKS